MGKTKAELFEQMRAEGHDHAHAAAVAATGCDPDPCDGTGWTGNPRVRCTTHYEPLDSGWHDGVFN